MGTQVLQGQHESDCAHEFFSLAPEDEVGKMKTKLGTSSWT